MKPSKIHYKVEMKDNTVGVLCENANYNRASSDTFEVNCKKCIKLLADRLSENSCKIDISEI